jgi:glucose-6-phosphate 1-epimerase
VYLHGAHTTSWTPAGERDDRLFTSASSPFAPGVAIRGGVPVCFPQFADQGPLPMHGFARLASWDVVRTGPADDGAAQAQLRLSDSASTRDLWPHRFTALLTVTVGGATLALDLLVANTGATPFAFTMALHTYLRVADIGTTRVHGLHGVRYRDKLLQVDDVVETAAELLVDRPLDRIYHAVPAVLQVREPDRSLTVRATGVFDTVIWNPGPARGAGLPDLDHGGYARMLCVEAAVAARAVTLLPAESWRGTQALTAQGEPSPGH